MLDTERDLTAEWAFWQGQGLLPDHFSASQYGMHQRCPEQYRRRYVLGEKVPPNSAMVWGSADSYAAEVNFGQKIETHVDLSATDLADVFSTGFDHEVEAAGEVRWNGDTRSQVKDRGVQLALAYHMQVAPQVQPIAIEQEFTIAAPAWPVPVLGYADVETEKRIIERKTASSRQIRKYWRVQGELYQLGSDKNVEWHLSVKTKTPSVWTPETMDGLMLTDSNPDHTVAKVANAMRGILNDLRDLGPDNKWAGAMEHDWACDPKWCGYRANGSCGWWK